MKLIKDVEGVVAGEIYPRVIEAGADCPQELEAAAIALGAVDPAEVKAAKKAPENK